MSLKEPVQKNLYLTYLFACLICAVIQFFFYLNVDLESKEVSPLMAVVSLIFIFVLGPALSGGLFSVTISAHYKNKASFQQFLQDMVSNYWKMFKLFLCIFLITVAVFFTAFLVVFLLSFFPPVAIPAMIILSIGLGLFIIYLAFQCSLLVIKDGLKSWQSVNVSILSLKQAFKKILVSVLITYGMNIALTVILFIAGALFIFPIVLFTGFSETDPISLFLASLISQLAITFSWLVALSIYIKRYKEKIEPELTPAGHKTA